MFLALRAHAVRLSARMGDTEHFVKSKEYLLALQARMTNTPRLLIVEDCQADALLLLTALEGFDVHSEVTYSSADALVKLKESKYDVSFVDAKMLAPFDGLDLIYAMVGHDSKTEFIMVTGYPDAAIKSNMVRAGALLMLPKPVKRETLSLLFKPK
jgi:DNA-binding NtrC family response regulator